MADTGDADFKRDACLKGFKKTEGFSAKNIECSKFKTYVKRIDDYENFRE